MAPQANRSASAFALRVAVFQLASVALCTRNLDMALSTPASRRKSGAFRRRFAAISRFLATALWLIVFSPSLCHSQVTEEDWKRKAVEKYPALGVLGSTSNKRFRDAHEERRKANPNFFANPQWPLILADELAATSSAPVRKPPTPRRAEPQPAGGQSADFQEAKALAEKGDVYAQSMLGYYYASGEGVPKDMAEAVRWWGDAAEHGESTAQSSLGRAYLIGDGIPEDFVAAVKWLTKAAQQGDSDAQSNLGHCYAAGKGVPEDFVAAVKWYRKAAEQGLDMAQSQLGSAYYNGKGVPRDYIEAYKWFSLSAAHGRENPKKFLDDVQRALTPDQIAEAQRLTREFKPSNAVKPNADRTPGGIVESGPSATGTGFFITENGFVLTNAHVVKDGAKFQLMTPAGIVNARVVRVDAANDIALLKAEGRFMPLAVTTSRGVRLGNTVATVGFPNVGLQGFAPKLAKGEVAAMSGSQDDPRYFQISVPVQPGNSGGALVDERGNVVGIVAAKLSAKAALAASGALPENVNYAVKSSYLLGFLESVPDVSAKLKEPNTKDEKFEDVVKSAEQAAVLVLVY
jgi:S1-C subfamily serine protease